VQLVLCKKRIKTKECIYGSWTKGRSKSMESKNPYENAILRTMKVIKSFSEGMRRIMMFLY
jgi:hypothetical protein